MAFSGHFPRLLLLPLTKFGVISQEIGLVNRGATVFIISIEGPMFRYEFFEPEDFTLPELFACLNTGRRFKIVRTQVLTERITDFLGRVLESKQNLPANGSLQGGENYRPGVYFVELAQGKEKRSLN